MKEDIILNVIDTFEHSSQYKLVKKSSNNNSFSLFCYGNMWTKEFRNKQVLQLRDTGNGVDITIGGTTIKLDYSQMLELYLALDYYSEVSRDILEIQKFKEV